MSRAAEILALARRRGSRIATAESCTGGLIAGALTEVAGSSDVIEGGVVSYSNSAKTALLGVPEALIARTGAVSEEVAAAMAEGALTAFDKADLSVAVTGIAGPGGSEHKPEGRVCFALAQRNGTTISETKEFGALGRGKVRAATVAHALEMLSRAL